MNSVLAIVHIIPGDKIIKEKVDKPQVDPSLAVKPEEQETKPATEETTVKAEEEGGVKDEDGEKPEVEQEGDDADAKAEEEEEDDDDDVPYIEDIGTREVAGFIVMSVSPLYYSGRYA
jgi:polyribonucleotide 5'-hydroxyl-kinase